MNGGGGGVAQREQRWGQTEGEAELMLAGEGAAHGPGPGRATWNLLAHPQRPLPRAEMLHPWASNAHPVSEGSVAEGSLCPHGGRSCHIVWTPPFAPQLGLQSKACTPMDIDFGQM